MDTFWRHFAWRCSILALLALSSCAMTVRNDRGGLVIDYALKLHRIEEAGTLVRFTGYCASACTIYLGATRKCIVPGAYFGFHRPWGSTPENHYLAAAYMMSKWPGWVQDWIIANNALSDRIKIMPYAYAVRHIPRCS